MKSILMTAALLVAMFGSNFALAQNQGLPDETDSAPAVAPVATPVAAPQDVQEELKACVQDLQTSKDNAAGFLERAKVCEKAFCDKPENKDHPICNGVRVAHPSKPATTPSKPKPRPQPPKPTTCETPDKQVLPAVDGSCEIPCADSTHMGTPDHVAVRGLTPTAQICVVRRVAFADLTGRVVALEKAVEALKEKDVELEKALAELKAQLDALRTMTGKQFELVFAQLWEQSTQLQDHERRLKALEAAQREQVAWNTWIQGEIEKLRKNRSVQLVRISGLAEVGFVGNAGANFALGGRLEYENRFTADSIASFFAGVGATVAPVHQDNTFGTIYLPFVDAGVRIHTDDSHVFGIDLGATYQVRLDGHPAGYLGKPSQYDGSNFGPSLGFMWNFHRHMHLMGRGTVGFGPENHLDGNAIALEYPVQPRFFLGFGGTIGL